QELGFAFNTSHHADFFYGVQALGTNVITGESGLLVGSVGGNNIANVSVFDQQCYANLGCTGVFPSIDFSPQFGLSSDPIQSIKFGPVCGSDGLGVHSLNSFSFTPATALLNTSTILYEVGPVPGPQSTAPITDLGTFGGSQS